MNRPFVGPNLEPPEPPPECLWCDGEGDVQVLTILDAGGREHIITERPFMTCMRCNGDGCEPEPDPYDDPRIP